MKYLITNADDYGYRPDISRAIIDSHLHGILTSTTVLINFVSEEDVDLAKKTQTLGFGLHLNLTSGEPLTSNWKSKYGPFKRPFRNEPQQFDREVWIPFFEQFRTEDIYQEYLAQFNKFIELFDKQPTHIDSHHYSCNFKNALPAYLRLAQEHDLPMRRPCIWEVAAKQHPMGNITTSEELDKQMIGKKTTNYFSLEYLNRDDDFISVFETEMNKIEDDQIIEISFHPGFEEEWRKKDLEILKSQDIKEFIAQHQIRLVAYDIF